jgi:probable rRNA maturation factor
MAPGVVSPALRVDLQYAARRPWVPSDAALRRWARAAYALASSRSSRRGSGALQGARLGVRVVGPGEGRRLNRQFRGRDKATNVLSFPSSPEERRELNLLGDLVICAPVVDREAREQGKERAAHWAHMVVHGVLHLLGYDHQDPREARRMERVEVEILAGFGYQNPYLVTTSPTA